MKNRSYLTVAGLTALVVTTLPSALWAWDLVYDGDSTFQSKCDDGTGDPNDPATWVPGDPEWLVTNGENGNWLGSVGTPPSSSWADETVILGGTTPLGSPTYLFRDDVDTSAQWGARFGVVSAANHWNQYTWKPNNLSGTYPTATDPTHKFTLVFRMQNLGSRRYEGDPLQWNNRWKCVLEVGSWGVYKKRDFVYSIIQQDAAEGGPYNWYFNDDRNLFNSLGGTYVREAEPNFEIYRLIGDCFVYADGSSLTGYRESMNMRLYKDEFPEPVQDLWGGGKDKQADYFNNHDDGPSTRARPFYGDIMFRFPKLGGAEMTPYKLDWVRLQVGDAWQVGEGEDSPIVHAGYKRTFTIDPARTRITVTVSTDLGSDSDVTSATGQVGVYLDPNNSPTSILLDQANLNFSEPIDVAIDSGAGIFSATASDMTLDQKMWWTLTPPSSLLPGACGVSNFEWNAADSQDYCIARAPGEEWNNEDDVEYTQTGSLTYTATGDICTAMQALDPPLPCDNVGSPQDLSSTVHQQWAAELNAGDGCWVNLNSVKGLIAGGESPEASATLYYQFSKSSPLVAAGGSYFGVITVEAQVVAVSGENPPAIPWPPFPPPPPDHDGDGDVDRDDYDHFESCATGPSIGPVAEGCQDVDLDGDNDVDQRDFAVFQVCYSGEELLDPTCTEVLVSCQ